MKNSTWIISEEQFKIVVRAYFPDCEFTKFHALIVHGTQVRICGYIIQFGIMSFGAPEIHVRSPWTNMISYTTDYDMFRAEEERLVQHLKDIKCKVGEV